MTATDHNLPAGLAKWPWWVWLLIALFPIPWGPWWLTIISLSLFGVFAWLVTPKVQKPKTQDDILRGILIPLADEFEAGNRRGAVDPASIEHHFGRDYVALLIAEGSLTEFRIGSRRTGTYQLTQEGYSKYKSQIAALRASPPLGTELENS